MQEYDNEAEQAICDVGIHYTDTPLDAGKCLLVPVMLPVKQQHFTASTKHV